MSYIGQIGDKVTAVVTVLNDYKYTDYKFSYYGTECHIYSMRDEAGNLLMWKTASALHFTDDDGGYCAKRGDQLRISGKIKAHAEYKGEPQTVLTRVKCLEVLKRAMTKEEREEVKRNEQLASLVDGDFIWRMPYAQYKDHYSDCETIAGSYGVRPEEDRMGYVYAGRPCIDVIIRAGRLKNSGSRGKHYRGFALRNQRNEMVTFRAICEDNAIKRAREEYPGDDWECVQIFEYYVG